MPMVVVSGGGLGGLSGGGDPVGVARRYERGGADGIVFRGSSASAEDRGKLLDVARRTAERLFIPLTIGGGIRSVDDVGNALRAGADKVSINSAPVRRPPAEGQGGRGVQLRRGRVDQQRREQPARGPAP